MASASRAGLALSDIARRCRLPVPTAYRLVHSLVEAGLLESAPRDPKGGFYAIADGRAKTELDYEVMKLNLPRGEKGS